MRNGQGLGGGSLRSSAQGAVRLGERALSRASWGRRRRAWSLLPVHRLVTVRGGRCPPTGRPGAGRGRAAPATPPKRLRFQWGAPRCGRGLAVAQTQAVGSPGQQREKSGPPVGGASMPELQGHSGLSSSTPRLIDGGHSGALEGEARPSGSGRKEAVASTSGGRWAQGLT